MSRILNNKYEILQKIDENEKVWVYRSRVLNSNKIVTIKILKKKWVKDERWVKKFTDELSVMSALSHPGIIKVLDVDYVSGVYYVALEYFEGENLYEIIARDMYLSLYQVLNVIMQLGKILDYAARSKVKYRTVMFSNIIINKIGRVKVLNFNIPRSIFLDTDLPIKEPTGVGSDIFFLGFTLLAMLEGKFPRDQSNRVITDMNLPSLERFRLESRLKRRILPEAEKKEIEKIIERSVTSDISLRYKTIDEFLEDIKKFCDKFPRVEEKNETVIPREDTLKMDEVKKKLFADQEIEVRTDKESLRNKLKLRFEGIGAKKTSYPESTLIWQSRGKLHGESFFSKVSPTLVIILFIILIIVALVIT